MSNFLNTANVPNGKLDLHPIQNALSAYEFSAAEWNQVCQDLLDLRGQFLSGFMGLQEYAASPISLFPALSGTHLWAKDDGSLVLTRSGVDHTVYPASASTLITLSAASTGSATQQITGQVTQNGVGVQTRVVVETFAHDATRGQITVDSGTEQMNTGAPAGKTSTAVILTDSGGNFVFTVTSGTAEDVLARVTANGAPVAQVNLAYLGS